MTTKLERKYPGIFAIYREKPLRDVRRGLAWLSVPGNKFDPEGVGLYTSDGL